MLKILFTTIHPSWHFYAATAGAFLGIIVSVSMSIYFCASFLWLLLALALLLIVLRLPFRVTLVFAFLAGLIIGNFRASPTLLGQIFFQSNIGQTVTLTGKVSDDPDFSTNTIHLNHLCLRFSQDDEEVCQDGTAYVRLGNKLDLERSDQITVQGKLGEGFGTYVTSIFRPTVLAIEKATPGDVFAKFKNFFASQVRDYVASPEVDLGLGYLMGMKSGLSEEFSEALQLVGMTHVVVASGAHLGILVGAAKKIFGRFSKFAGLLFSLLLIVAFVMTVGFTPSMTRAALVSALALVFGYVGRKFQPWRLLLLVATITLVIEPINFLSLGWQLSFASFFGILILAPRLCQLFYGGKNPPWLASMLITSFATSLICAPILIYNFGSFSLLAFVANLVILPTLPYAMLAIFLVGVTSFLPFLAGIFGHLATLVLDFHINIINFLKDKTMFIFSLPASDSRFFLLYIPIIAFMAWPLVWRLYRQHKPEPTRLAKMPELCYNKDYES